MNSTVFEMMGLGGIDPAIFVFLFLVIVIVLIIMIIVQNSKITKLKHDYDVFMGGKTPKSMESEVMDLFEDMRYLMDSAERCQRQIEALQGNMLFAHQKLGLVRYDAFREMGGKLSFSLAILDDFNNGFILNSVHSTDGCYTYTKEIVEGKAFITLGEEEKEALDKALACDTHPRPKKKPQMTPAEQPPKKKKKAPVKKAKSREREEYDEEFSEDDLERDLERESLEDYRETEQIEREVRFYEDGTPIPEAGYYKETVTVETVRPQVTTTEVPSEIEMDFEDLDIDLNSIQ